MTRRWYWLLDLIFSLLIIFLVTYYKLNPQPRLIRYTTYALLFRLIRALQLLQYMKAYKVIFEAISKLIPLFVDIFGVLFFVFYFYCIIGIHLLGGRLNTSVDLKSHGIPDLYIYNNFNDFASGLVTFFELLIINNWNVQIEMFSIVYGAKYVKLFFVSFYIFGCILSLGIIVAFTIDIIINHLIAAQIEKKEEILVRTTTVGKLNTK
eukprot:TRINITY_DN7231_c0_g1_i8.p1 TRINITY_DN7231_c0_g1~~TRINITY_DN7231_c0_g1_i8.p1  ORF type:complete len:208 (-),score=23.61 TRINITY_DN7231_c0_g1_i8:23-646(-)